MKMANSVVKVNYAIKMAISMLVNGKTIKGMVMVSTYVLMAEYIREAIKMIREKEKEWRLKEIKRSKVNGKKGSWFTSTRMELKSK